MAYDLEKYRDRRERVLGIKKRSIGFGTIATIISLCLVIGLGVIIVPQAVSYFNTRHLEDAIFKLSDSGVWSDDMVVSIAKIDGVKTAVTDNKDTRLVITFDKHIVDIHGVSSFFEKKGIAVDLLNQMNHRQRISLLKKEAEFEAL